MPSDTERRARLLAAAMGGVEVPEGPLWGCLVDNNIEPVPTSDGDYLLALLEALQAKGHSVEFWAESRPRERLVKIHRPDGNFNVGHESDPLTALILAAERALGVKSD